MLILQSPWEDRTFDDLVLKSFIPTEVEGGDDRKVYSVTLTFQRQKGASISSDSVALICLKGDSDPIEFVRMDYVGQIVGDYWGLLGNNVLNIASESLNALSNDKPIKKSFILPNSRPITLQLTSSPNGISILGHANPVEWNRSLSCLKWLWSTLSHDTPSVLRARWFIPSSATHANSQSVTYSAYNLKEQDLPAPDVASNKCWLRLLDGGNIGLYEENLDSVSDKWVGKGLRIPFQILSQIAGVDEVVEIDGTPVLCGFETALIPIELFSDKSVQWHFVTAGDEDRFRWISDKDDFLQSLPPERLKNVRIEELMGTAYVGGWASITTILGTNEPPDPIQRSRLSQTKYQYVRSGVDFQGSIQVATPGSLTAFFGITQKLELVGIRSHYTPEENLFGMVDQLYSKHVIIYDESEKTGYLCRLINLIVSLVRAYLRDNRYDYRFSQNEFGEAIENNQANIRRLLTQKIDEAHDFSLGDIFKIVTKRYSSVNATLRQERRCTKSAILGFEIADILDSNNFYARKLTVTSGVKVWRGLAELIDVVFCGAYGDVILPSGGPPCSQRAPSGCDILMCPLTLLKQHFDLVEGNCYQQRGRKNFVWLYTGSPFECYITQSGGECDGRECWAHRLQCINTQRPQGNNGNENNGNENRVPFDDDGAIGFGNAQNIRRTS